MVVSWLSTLYDALIFADLYPTVRAGMDDIFASIDTEGYQTAPEPTPENIHHVDISSRVRPRWVIMKPRLRCVEINNLMLIAC